MNNGNNNDDLDLMSKVISFIKRKPFIVIGTLLGFAATFILIIGVYTAITYPVVSVANFFSTAWENVVDFFTSDEENTKPDMSTKEGRHEKCVIDFQIEDETSPEGKTTLEYCEELYKVTMDYKDNYGVSINPMLITATLFYGRTYGEYTSEGYTGEACDENGNGEDCEKGTEILDESNFSSWFSDPEFNKKAKKYIKTLAGFMLIRTESHYSCGDTTSSSMAPESIEELVKADIDKKSGAAKRTATYVSKYNGDPSDPGSCPYEDDAKKNIDKYKVSHSYSTLKKNYENVQKYCDDDPDSYDCKRATDSYEHNRNFLFSQWEEKGILNEPPGSTSINFACKYVHSSSAFKENTYKYDGCAESPYETVHYSTDYSYQGLYYYRLMTPMSNYIFFFEIPSKDSFLSKYYDYIIKNDADEINEEVQQEMVDGIYELYESVICSQPFDFSEIGISIGTACGESTTVTGDWVEWSQKHEPWQSFQLGVGSDTTIYNIGCAMTSLSKIIAMSGASSTFIYGDFNPGTFAEAMKANGGFTSGGAIMWGVTNRVVPGFQYVTSIECPLGDCNSQVVSLVNEGYYVVIKVIANEHWVAVTGVDGDTIMINDTVAPEGVAETIKPISQSKYSGIYGIRVFELRM